MYYVYNCSEKMSNMTPSYIQSHQSTKKYTYIYIYIKDFYFIFNVWESPDSSGPIFRNSNHGVIIINSVHGD